MKQVPTAAQQATLAKAVFHPTTRGEYIAYWISQLCSPPMMALFALILIAWALALPRIWLWVGLYILLAMLLPLLYLLWLLHNGKITDLDIQLREQRSGPFLVTMGGQIVAFLLMLIGRAPNALLLMTGTMLIQSLVIFCITLRWKISVHTSTAAGMSVLMIGIMGRVAAPVMITIPLLAWSRVKLGRHTRGQTIAGMLLGSALFLAAVWLNSRL